MSAPKWHEPERQAALLREMHPDLRSRVEHMLAENLGGRFAVLCAFRDPKIQLERFKVGRIVRVAADGVTVIASSRIEGKGVVTNARPMSSPHNYRPSLAADLVLHPDRTYVGKEDDPARAGDTRVGPHPDDASKVNLWETRPEYPAAKQAWRDLGRACMDVGLQWGGAWKNWKDLPHVELVDWKKRAGID